MSALPEDINTTLISILQGFASPDNTIRAQAELALQNTWITPENIEVLLIFLSEQASFSSDATTSALSAVLFRKLALRAPPSSKTVIIAKNITSISNAALQQIRATLLKGFFTQQNVSIRHKLSDAIAVCALDDMDKWTQLLECVFQAMKSDDPTYRESSFRILTTVPYLINNVDSNLVLSVFEAGFTDANDDVKVSAVSAFVGYFRQLPKSNWAKLGVLLPSLLNSLPKFLEDAKDYALSAAFEPLIELIELAPKLFKDMFNQIIQFVDIVIKTKDLDASTRTSALELLTVFSENAPQMCKSNPNYGNTVVMDTLMMMTEVSEDDDNAIEWQNSDDTDDNEEEVTYDHARQALDRVALKLNGKYLAPFLFQYLEPMMQSSEWRERFAALMALSSAAEGCRDVLISKIGKILDMVIPLVNDPHPRVQYGACNALGQISTDFAPLIQRVSHERIVPALISRLSNDCCSRVQTHGAAALVNFSEEASQSILEPYLDSLLSNLLTLLQSDKTYVQEQALTTIAFIAEAAEKKFIKYYDTLMPQLIHVLKTDTGDENRVLKGKCMECSTLIALAVGREKFGAYSQELLECFVHYQKQDIKDDDPIKSYLEYGWSRICRIMREEFVPFLPLVLPPLLLTAKATQDVSLIEEEEAESFQQYNEWDVVQIQGKHIAIHTSILDDKVTAMDLINVYASILKSSFVYYANEILLEIAIPSIDFYLHDGVRATGAKLISVLLGCLISANGVDDKVFALWKLACDKLLVGMNSEPMPEILQIYHKVFVDCLDITEVDCLSEEQVGEYTKATFVNLTDVYTRVKTRHGEDDEYNEDVDDEADDYTDEDLLDEINKSLASIFKLKTTAFLPHFESLWNLITTSYLQQDSEIILSLFALVAIADMVQYCGESTAPLKVSFGSKVQEYLTSPEPSIRQAAAYVVGSCAIYAPQSYSDLCNSSLPILVKVIVIPDARSDENITSTENANAAIAKILHTFGPSIPQFNDYVSLWLKSFPVIQDEEAANYSYKFLGELINSNNPAVQGLDNISNIVKYVVEALYQKSLSSSASESIIASTKSLLDTVPQDQVMSLFGNYPEPVMNEIKKWFS
ncbi:importin PSE1 SCDLUD_004422 [Saccharomycodes ludwigii]|uniref:importin PSE1 n=1 Tax=Saccharomycodes ludwigii TaxID=36035 RepID=UPI001E86776E|nr:hypothetical protein SCDLUD_004422 [Saccharomycodes ludwigii]KAH3899001.1 hypothetical protein SCDLUD_004422 [Saccharomycodes ludwigii]